MNWTPSPWFLAQMNHLLAGCIILLASRVGGLDPAKTLCWLLLAAAFKEFVADLMFLEHDSFAGSLADFAFYALGGAGGWLACGSFWWGVALTVAVVLVLTAWDILAQRVTMPYD